jgi:hypothetical protein
MAPDIDPNINPIIWTAIEQKRLLRFRYKNRERIVEPHDYGIHKGVIKLFGYQVAGSSSQKLPNWRWAEQNLNARVLFQLTFRHTGAASVSGLPAASSNCAWRACNTRAASLPAGHHLKRPLDNRLVASQNP